MSEQWVAATYRGKKVYTGHYPRHTGKITTMEHLLCTEGWCFPPVPVVDLGDYFQALDGSHRIAACKHLGREPELAIIDARMHPEQPIPGNWKEIVNAPLVRGRTIRGFGLRGSIRENHIGVVLDVHREILRVEYVEHLFNVLLDLTRKVRVINKKAGS